MGHGHPSLAREHFGLLDDVIALTDIAMTSHDVRRIVPMMVDGLRGVIAAGAMVPAELLQVGVSGYVRRELYRSAAFGYQVLAMTWAPGQGSGVHDHADTWGVEAVLRGHLEVVDYRIAGQHRSATELRPSAQHLLSTGDVIGLYPPHDLHACRNAGVRDTAVTLHVYGTPLDSVRRFVHMEDALYRAEHVHLVSA